MFEGGGYLPPEKGKPIRVTANVGEFILAMQAIKRATDKS